MRKPDSYKRTVDCATRIAKLCSVSNLKNKTCLSRLEKSLPFEHSYHKVRDKSVLLLLMSNGARNKELPTLIEGVLGAEDCIDSYADNEYIESFLVAALRQEVRVHTVSASSSASASSSGASLSSRDDVNNASTILRVLLEASTKMQFHMDCIPTLLFLAFMRVVNKNPILFKDWCVGCTSNTDNSGSAYANSRDSGFVAKSTQRSAIIIRTSVNMFLSVIGKCTLELNKRNGSQNGMLTNTLCGKTLMLSMCYEALNLSLESALLIADRDTSSDGSDSSNSSVLLALSEGENQLGKIFDLCDGVISADSVLIELLSAISSHTTLSNGICAMFCGMLSRYYSSAQSCLLSVCSISAALDHAVPIQSVRHRGTQCLKHLFDLWQHCHGYFQAGSAAHEMEPTDGISVHQIWQGQGAPPQSFDWKGFCAVVCTPGEDRRCSNWSSLRKSMQQSTSCIVHLLDALSSHLEINAARPDTPIKHTYCFELTRDVSDYVLSLYVQQCSTGELLYCDTKSPSRVMLRSDVVAGMPIYGFTEQDGEIGHDFADSRATSKSFVHDLLRSLCALFAKELYVSPASASATVGRLGGPTGKNMWSYEDTNCYYFICSVLHLSYPNSNQNEILVSLYSSFDADSQSVINSAVAPVTVGSVRTNPQLQQGFSSNMVPFVYTISATMLRLLGHIVVLLNSSITDIVSTKLTSDPLDDSVARLITGNSKFKDQVFQGFQQLHKYIGGLITQHLDLDSREQEEDASVAEDEVTGFGGVALKPMPPPVSNTLAPGAASSTAMMNSYVWIVYSCINHQLCRMVISELSCYCNVYFSIITGGNGTAAGSVGGERSPAANALLLQEDEKYFSKAVKFLTHSFVSMVDVAAKILSGCSTSHAQGAKTAVSLFYCSSDQIVSTEVEGTTCKHHWRFCRECLSGLSEQYMYLLHNITSLRGCSTNRPSQFTHFLLDELVGLFNSKSSQYSTVFYFAHSGAMIEAGLGFLLLPISACLKALSDKKNSDPSADTRDIKFAHGDIFGRQSVTDGGGAASQPSNGNSGLSSDMANCMDSSKFREFWYSLSSTLFSQAEVYATRAATTYTLTGVLYSTTAPTWKECVHAIACCAPPLLFNYTPADGVESPGCAPGSACPYEILALLGSTTVSTTFETASPNVTKITSTLAYAEPLHSNCMLAKYWDIYRHGSPAAQQKTMVSNIVALIREHISSVIPSVHHVSKRIVQKLPVALVIYLSSIVHLESIRASEHLDLRVFFQYLGRSVCVNGTCTPSSSGSAARPGMSKMELKLQTILISVSEHIYEVWEDAVLRQLGPGVNAGSAVGAASHSDNSVMFATPVHQTIRAVFGFCLVRMISASEVVRRVASNYARHMLKRFRWLQSDKSSVFTMLDTMRALLSELPVNADPALCNSPMYALPYYYDHRTVDGGTAEVNISINPWAPTFTACVGKMGKNMSLVLRLLEQLLLFTYQWLSDGRNPVVASPTAATEHDSPTTFCTHTPKDTTLQTILQEYMFSNDFVLSAEQSASFLSVPSQKDVRTEAPCHTISYEIAKEMCYSTCPRFHEVGMATVNIFFPLNGHIKKSKWTRILNNYDLNLNSKQYTRDFLFFIIRCRCSAAVAVKLQASVSLNKMSLGVAATEPHIASSITNNEVLMKADAFASWSKIRGSTAWVANPLRRNQGEGQQNSASGTTATATTTVTATATAEEASSNYFAKLVEQSEDLVRMFRLQVPASVGAGAGAGFNRDGTDSTASALPMLSLSAIVSNMWRGCTIINGFLYHTSFSGFNNTTKHRAKLRRLLKEMLDVVYTDSFASCYNYNFVVENLVSCWKWLFSLCSSSGRVKEINVVEKPLLSRLDVVQMVASALQCSQQASCGLFYNSYYKRRQNPLSAGVGLSDIDVDVGSTPVSDNENILLLAPSNRWNYSCTMIDCGLMSNADVENNYDEACIWETKPQQDALTLLQSWLNIYPDCYSFVLQPVARLISNLASNSIYQAKSGSSATSNYADIDYNSCNNNKEFMHATNSARLNLLSFALELIHLSLSRPYSVVDFVEGGMKIHFSPTSRRVLRENVMLIATHSFKYGLNSLATSNIRGKRAEMHQTGSSFSAYMDSSKRTGVASIFAMHSFLSRLQVDMKYWNMEYHKEGDVADMNRHVHSHERTDSTLPWDSALSFMTDNLQAVNTTAGVFDGEFRRKNSIHGGDSLIHHKMRQNRLQHGANHILRNHKRYAMALNVATQVSDTGIGGSCGGVCSCGLSGPATPMTPSQCGVYLMLKSFLVDEICRQIAWICPAGVRGYVWEQDNDALNTVMTKFLTSYMDMYEVIKHDTKLYKQCIRAAWVQSPSLAVALHDRFPRANSLDGVKKKCSVLTALFRVNKLSLRHHSEMTVRLHGNSFHDRYDMPVIWSKYAAAPAADVYSDENENGNHADSNSRRYQAYKNNALNSFVHWGYGSADLCIELLTRIHSYGSEMQLVLHQTDGGNVGVYCSTDHHQVLIMEPGVSSDVNSVNPLHTVPVVVLYCIRSLKALPLSVILFYLPQLVQLLRRDVYGLIAKLIAELSALSASICHQVVWLLQTETVDENTVSHGKKKPAEIQATVTSDTGISPRASMASDGGGSAVVVAAGGGGEGSPKGHKDSNKSQLTPTNTANVVANARHGRCREMSGADPMPRLSRAVISTIRQALSASSLAYLDAECEFFNSITNISALLTLEKDKSKHNMIIHDALVNLGRLPDGLYMPTAPTQRVISIDTHSGIPMQSAAKCPYLLIFHTETWAGPDSFGHKTTSTAELTTSLNSVCAVEPSKTPLPAERGAVVVKARSNRGLGAVKTSGFGTPKVVRTNSNTTGNGNAVFTPKRLSEDEDEDEEDEDKTGFRPQGGVGAVSASGTRMTTLSTDACIFKVYDDCRQDALTLQLFQMLKAVYIALGLPLTLICYGIIPNRSGANMAVGGILEVIKNVHSRHQLGSKLGARTLSQYFTEKFGLRTLKPFKEAQMRFAESMAGYAVVTYLLWVKDR